MRTLFDETKFSLFANRSDWPSLVERLDRVALEPREAIQACVVASKTPILRLLRELEIKLVSSERIRLTDLDDPLDSPAVSAFSLQRHFGPSLRKSVKGDFLVIPTSRENISVLLFVEPIAFWNEGLSRLLDSVYPRLIKPFFTQTEMYEFVRNVQHAIPARRVRVLRISALERLRSGEGRKKFASSLRWTDSDVDTAFREAKAANSRFRSVLFELANKVEEQLVSENTSATISKYGYFNCTARFSLFLKAVIEPMIESAYSRLKFLENRSRRANTDFTPKPIKIEYDSEVFSSPAQVRKLLDVLKRFKHGSCSVLHANPYLHVSMMDNYDFSSAEVWVLSRSEVLIVPQIRTSDASLKRIIGHIYEQFREGRLAEFTA